jgi:hypothetical protein
MNIRMISRSRLALLVVSALIFLGAGVYVATRSSEPVANQTRNQATHTPQASPTSNPVAVSGPTSPPSVAGARTAAPKPNPTVYAPAKPSIPQPPKATLTISVSNAANSYGIILSGVTDACKILELAKQQGKISSYDIDSSYRSSFKSDYVREINGYKDAWQVKVNGISPKGCSLASVTEGDTVTWTYQ